MQIPEDVTLKEYSVQLRRGATYSGYRGNPQSFTVGVPRTPTVELGVKASRWVSPTGVATVTVKAESFVGASLGKQEISVEWHLKYEADGETVDLGETETIVTDNSGTAIFTLDLSELQHSPPVDKKIDFAIRWIGPTGELIEEEASTDIAWEDLSIELKRTVSTEVPQQPFGVWVELTDLDGNAFPKGKYKEAQLYLKQVADDASYDETDRGSLDAAVIQTCNYQFHHSDPCQFRLPSMNVFVIEACITLERFALCRRISVGRPETNWFAQPLTSFVPLGIYTVDQGVYKAGDSYEIFFDNPYANAHAMIVWGNTEGVQHRVEKLPDHQRSSIVIKLKKACEFGCSFAAIVSIPRQTIGLATMLTVPISKLHDPAMPHVEFWKSDVRLEPVEDKDIQIGLSFPEATSSDEDVVLPPGVLTRLDVTVDRHVQTEVTVVIVDKAILELMSNPLPPISDFFEISAEYHSRHETSISNILSPGAIQALLENFSEKKEINPWFDIHSDVSFPVLFCHLKWCSVEQLHRDSSSPDIDATIDAYLERLSQYITIHPDYDYVPTVYYYYYDEYDPYSHAYAMEP